MAAAAAALNHPPPAPLLAALTPLPFTLDLACPLPLPTKPSAATPWPLLIAGSSTGATESLDAYVRRRYHEALFLGELLAPLSTFVADLERAVVAHGDAVPPLLAGLMLALSAIEQRHRRTLGPAITASVNASLAPSAVGQEKIDDAMKLVEEEERNMLSSAVDLRLRSRAIADGERALLARTLIEEFERREVLVQVILLLLYRAHHTTETEEIPKKKKKRKRSPPSPIEDTTAALEHLADRIGVWAAIDELDIGFDMPTVAASKDKKKEETGILPILRAFWDTVLVPIFLPRETSFCASFHAKVFGSPIPPDLMPQKKPRKPKVTRRLSVESGPKPKLIRTASARELSRPSSRASPPPDAARGLRRSVSRASDTRDKSDSRRSRSSSMDPIAREPAPRLPRPLVRAASGKDLFKGREVGLMRGPLRRTTSLMRSNSLSQSQSQSQSQSRGLLGRKVEPPPPPKAANAPPSARPRPAPEPLRDPGTLIMATPAKRSASFFGSLHHPTPIREEPSSGGSRDAMPSYIAETPVAPSRHRGVAETPVGRQLDWGESVQETPAQRPRMSGMEMPMGVLEEDDFGELMVPTDDETDVDETAVFVPETPSRA